MKATHGLEEVQKALVSEIDEATAFTRPNNQHSILELVWHMVTWREFIIDRLKPAKTAAYFEENDWRELDHTDKTLWPTGLQKLQETQEQLLYLFQNTEDAILNQPVKERSYDFRKLLHGLIQHDIYRLGQIAYINKFISHS
ncbi:MAG: DinB family protein [Flavisolibacter sp.]|nr:DinB family protein [Flavisolibacter sp.]